MFRNKINVPQEFICPLTSQIFLDPVMLPDSNIVEREFIEGWIEANGTNPFNRAILSKVDLAPASHIKFKIELFFSAHKNHEGYAKLKDDQYKATKHQEASPFRQQSIFSSDFDVDSYLNSPTRPIIPDETSELQFNWSNIF